MTSALFLRLPPKRIFIFSLTILTEHSREAEVRDDKMSIVIEKNVLGFEVPMNDS